MKPLSIQILRVWPKDTRLAVIIAIFGTLSFALGPAVEAGPAKSDASSSTVILIQKLKSRQKRFLTCRKDTDCATLAYGQAPCGGPAGYLIVNTKGSKDSQLNKIAEEISQAQRLEQQQQGLAGICMLAPKPQAKCAKQVCQEAQAEM